MYRLIAASPQPKKNLGLSFNSTDDKKGEKEVDLHVRVCAVLSDNFWAHLEK